MGARARTTIAIASGKGGVGKSTVSVNLAVTLAARGVAVGLLDLDIYGPDVPAMVGLTRRRPTKNLEVWRSPRENQPAERPVEAFGVKLMSTQFLLAEDQTVALSAAFADLLVHRMALALDWGDLDVLLLDLPPGTADLQQVVAKKLSPDGVIMVVTPQDVAHLDARKALTMYRKAKVPITGGVENMAGLACPGCGEHIEVFPQVPLERSIWADNVRRLASIPMEPAIARAGEEGKPAVATAPDGPVAQAFNELADALDLP